MEISALKIFKVGKELGYELVIFVPKDTYRGDTQHCGAQLNDELGHQALDGDFRVEDNDGTMITYRIPDLDGTPNTFVLGDNTFDLAKGLCFVLTSDYQAEQLPVRSEGEALRLLGAR
jgi:hypothetical protein